MQTSRAHLDIPPKAAHAVCSVNIESAQAENCKILVFVLPALAERHIGIALWAVVVVCCGNRLTFGSIVHML